jgi:glucoamylase
VHSFLRRQFAWMVLTLITFLTFSGQARCGDPSLEEWIAKQKTVAVQKLLSSISSSNDQTQGSVIASPSKNNPNYYYHWVRDAAIVTDIVITQYEQAQNDQDRMQYRGLLEKYIAFCQRIQTAQADGQAVTGIGEPKYFVNGSVYNDGWGRPQNDGPALRAGKLIRFANTLIGGKAKEDQTLLAALYTSQFPPRSLIHADLEFVARIWPYKNVDLWEETRGQHFYTRMVQHRALASGEQFARRMNDKESADVYLAEAKKLRPVIQSHLDATSGIIVPIKYGERNLNIRQQLDVAVILAVIHTHDTNSPLFPPTDENVLATAFKLSTFFSTAFPINVNVQINGDKRILQSGIGRYPGDQYDGMTTSGKGNPWFLATAALAELCYRAASDWSPADTIAITKNNIGFVRAALGSNAVKIAVAEGDQILKTDARHGQIVEALIELGDGYLRRVRQHSDQNTNALSEQFNGTTGFMQSAQDLSWSYASILTAFQQREKAVKKK